MSSGRHRLHTHGPDMRFIPGLSDDVIIAYCRICHAPIRNDDRGTVIYACGRFTCTRPHERDDDNTIPTAAQTLS